MAKNKNEINIDFAKELLTHGYSMIVKEMNFYQFRLRFEDSKFIYDWYHTTGSLVWSRHNDEGILYHSNIGTIKHPEDLAIFITKHREKNEI